MNRTLVENLGNFMNQKVSVSGWLYRTRYLKSVSFILLRDRTGIVQCVIENEKLSSLNLELKNESIIKIEGIVKEGKNTFNNFEIAAENIEVLVPIYEEPPIEVNKEEFSVHLDTMLNNRVLSLRHPKINSIFKIQQLISCGFREYLTKEGFTEIFTPKIVSEGAEGGTEIFKLKYFEQECFLAQSPQFYKQMLVAAGYERVFEVGHVFRAEQHNTVRHLNEYISLDLEIGFIEGVEDVMDLEEELLKYILEKINLEGQKYLKILGAEMPVLNNRIPRIEYKEVFKIIEAEYGYVPEENDLNPECERLISKYVKEKYNNDFVFITYYPRENRPMYTKPLNETESCSFDLLFRGLEITSGAERINTYEELKNNMIYKGLNPESFKNYLDTFKYGVPRHGGFGIGLERLTARFLELSNIREASLFPRDRNRILP